MFKLFNRQFQQISASRRMRWATAFLLLSLSFSAADVSAKSMVISEEQVKAVYLFNLTSFIDWPAEAFDSPDTPLRIAIAGEDGIESFITFIRMVINGETTGARPIVVERFSHKADPTGYHILFISTSNGPDVSRLIKAARGKPILTVGDRDGFCQGGGMINLVRSGNRIGIEANLEAAKAAKLKVSSKLLRIATIVEENGSK